MVKRVAPAVPSIGRDAYLDGAAAQEFKGFSCAQFALCDARSN